MQHEFMLVCHCYAVSDRTIRAAVDLGARSRQDIGDFCKAGTACGGCSELIDEVIDDASTERQMSARSVQERHSISEEHRVLGERVLEHKLGAGRGLPIVDSVVDVHLPTSA
ncbi:MAG: (2Fe-2S)-binding protein [Myxococcota bacterium]